MAEKTSEFDSGVMWAAFYLVTAFDQPSMATELCREAGITRKQLESCDVADRKASRIIRNEYAVKYLRQGR